MKKTLTRFLILIVLLLGCVFVLPGGNAANCTASDCCTDCVLARKECMQGCGADPNCPQACWGAYFLCRSHCGTCQ